MAYTGHLVDVVTTAEYDELHDTFGSLLWLAGLDSSFRPDAAYGANSGESPRSSPAASPVGARPEQVKMLALTRPLTVTIPPPLPAEELAFYHAYVQRHYLTEELDKQYIAFVFQEYKKRKSIESKYDAAIAELCAGLDAARQRELPPEMRRALEAIESEEESARAQLTGPTYGKFVAWVEDTIPQWLAAVHDRQAERTRQETARKAAMDAAKAALAAELLAGNKLPAVSSEPARDRVERDPYDATDYGVDIDIDVAPDSPAVSQSTLRQKAIKMLEQEEALVKQRRAQHLEQLRAEEETLRRRVEEKGRQQETAAQTQHEEELQARYAALLSEETALKSRISAQEADRAMQLEHMAAEEQLIRQRLEDKEAKRKAAEEEEKRVLYEHVRAEEQLLRERMQKREAAAAEAKRQEEAVREMHRQQEAALQRAKEDRQRHEEEQRQKEKATQLAYLQAQEDAYKSRLRAKELAEIEAHEQARQQHMQQDWQRPHQMAQPSQPYAAPSPVPIYADPARYAYPSGVPPVQPPFPPSAPLDMYGRPAPQAGYGMLPQPVYYTTGAVPLPGVGYTPPNAPFAPAVAYQPAPPPQGYYYRT